jgi:hypothetical protein
LRAAKARAKSHQLRSAVTDIEVVTCCEIVDRDDRAEASSAAVILRPIA